MNQITPEKSIPAPQTGEPTAIIAVKVTVPRPVPFLFPADNSSGSMMLAEQFMRELCRAKLLSRGDEICCGPLNDSVYVFPVARLAPALAIVEDIIKIPFLKACATVLIYLPAHGVFQPRGEDNANIGRALTMAKIREIGERWNAEKIAALETFASVQAQWQQIKTEFEKLRELFRNPPADGDRLAWHQKIQDESQRLLSASSAIPCDPETFAALQQMLNENEKALANLKAQHSANSEKGGETK